MIPAVETLKGAVEGKEKGERFDVETEHGTMRIGQRLATTTAGVMLDAITQVPSPSRKLLELRLGAERAGPPETIIHVQVDDVYAVLDEIQSAHPGV